MSALSAPDAATAPRRADANISKVPYLPGLDGLRAVAVIAVMIYHANSTWLKGGFIGVEVFFVISGYLITLLLIAEHEKTGAVDMKNFWVRRFRRLLPALFVMLLLLSIWTAIFERDALGQLRGDLLGGVFYISNWYQIFIGAGYSASNDFAPLRHLWSLAVEEQFYFIWPIVMVALLRKGSRKIADLSVWLFGAAVFVTVVVGVLYHPGPIDADPSNTPAAYWEIGGRFISKGDALYLSTLSRSGGLLLGAAFAMVWRPVAVMRGPLRNKAGALDGLAAIGFATLGLMAWKVGFIDTFGDNSADPWLLRGGFFVASIATLLIIAAVTHRDSLTSKMLSGPTILWIGTRSYGLYLYHWPIYQIVRNTAGTRLRFHEWVLCMVATVIVTEISYRYIETPIRKGQLAAAWRRRGERTRRNQNRGAVLGGVFVGTALAIFAGASLATAELKQNAVDESLKQSAGATCSVLLGTCEAEAEAEAAPAVEPTSEPALSNDPDAPVESAVDDVPATVASTVPLPAGPEKFALGDSVMLGAADELKASGFTVDAAESRSFVRGLDVVQALLDRGQLPQELVIHLGTNGPITNDQMDQMMSLVVDVPKVLLVQNVVPEGSYDEENNLLMINAASGLPNVEVLYWDGLAQQCQGDCIYQDGIHLKSTGAAYYTTLIETVLADGSLFA